VSKNICRSQRCTQNIYGQDVVFDRHFLLLLHTGQSTSGMCTETSIAKFQVSSIASRRLWYECAAYDNLCLSLFPQLRPFIGHVPKDVCSRPVLCRAFLHQRLHGPKKRRSYRSVLNRGVILSCLEIALLEQVRERRPHFRKVIAAQVRGTAKALIETVPAQSFKLSKNSGSTRTLLDRTTLRSAVQPKDELSVNEPASFVQNSRNYRASQPAHFLPDR
jgi:hypothetical protein